jgi:hypothetical protein
MIRKKGKPSGFVYFKSNLDDVLYNTWWIDSYYNFLKSYTLINLDFFMLLFLVRKNILSPYLWLLCYGYVYLLYEKSQEIKALVVFINKV